MLLVELAPLVKTIVSMVEESKRWYALSTKIEESAMERSVAAPVVSALEAAWAAASLIPSSITTEEALAASVSAQARKEQNGCTWCLLMAVWS